MEHQPIESKPALPDPTRYGDIIIWELPVQIAASFFLRKADCALDVGGNTGGVAIAFARQVGSVGRVISFECNPKMIAWMQQDLAANNIANVEIVTDAAYSEIGKTLSFYIDDSFYSAASSLYRPAVGTPLEVRTTTIDFVCKQKELNPVLIKIDVEGGEFDVLQGGASTIADVRPAIIFEYSGGELTRNPIDCLWRWGYEMYDTNTYERVDESYLAQRYSTNVLAVAKDAGLSFSKQRMGSFDPTTLPRVEGVTVIENDIEVTGEGTGELECVDAQTGERIAYYCAPLAHLQHHSCSAIVLSGGSRTVVMSARMRDGAGSIAIRKAHLSQIFLVKS